MAEDKTIGQLDPGNTIETDDEIPVKRGIDNVRVVVAPAATKAASDVTKSFLASLSGTFQIGHLAVFADEDGTLEDGGEVGAIITDADTLSPVFTTDFIPIVRDHVILLATVAEVLAAIPPPSDGGQFDFSNADNSGIAAGAM